MTTSGRAMGMGERKLNQLEKLDDKQILRDPESIFCFAYMRNEMRRLPYFLEYHRNLGVDRFFLMDNESDDGTREFMLAQPDCHCFHAEGSSFASNVYPPNWTNTLLNVFGHGHWCMNMDADELLVYPGSEKVCLKTLCAYLDETGAQAMIAPLLDMYSDGPITEAQYTDGQSFIDAAPYFDSTPGLMRANPGCYPAQLMFGGVRERVFWQGPFKKTNPPCLTKVPLVRWQRGMEFIAAQHTLSAVRFADVRGALLHFKFLTDFGARTSTELERNDGVQEKSLQEREAYAIALRRSPKLSLMSEGSARYRGTQQLVELGWMTSTPRFSKFLETSAGGQHA